MSCVGGGVKQPTGSLGHPTRPQIPDPLTTPANSRSTDRWREFFAHGAVVAFAGIPVRHVLLGRSRQRLQPALRQRSFPRGDTSHQDDSGNQLALWIVLEKCQPLCDAACGSIYLRSPRHPNLLENRTILPTSNRDLARIRQRTLRRCSRAAIFGSLIRLSRRTLPQCHRGSASASPAESGSYPHLQPERPQATLRVRMNRLSFRCDSPCFKHDSFSNRSGSLL
jgi:hypothetical protein